MTFHPEKRSQELIEIIEQQFKKIDELLSRSEKDLEIKLSTDNVNSSESQVNCDNDLLAIAVNQTNELVENDLAGLRASVASKGAEAKAIFTKNQIRFANSQAKFASK